MDKDSGRRLSNRASNLELPAADTRDHYWCNDPLLAALVALASC